MKKHHLLKSLLLLCALMAGSGIAWAETSTLTFTAACSGSGTADDGVTWTVTSDGSESTYDATKGIHYGTGKAAVQYIKLTTSGISGTITKIVVNCSTASGVSATVSTTVGGNAFGGDAQNVSETAANYTFDDSASGAIEVTLTKPSSAAKALYVKSVAVTYSTGGGGNSVSIPTLSVGTGTYTTAQNVSITCATDGANIYYTTDGTDPDNESTPYSSPVAITTSGTVLKAIAYKEENASSIVTATYTIKPNTPEISALGASVTITGDDGCNFYYTTNGTTPTSSSSKYTETFTLDADCIIKAIAYDTYGNESGVKSYTFKYIDLSPKNINSGFYEKVTDVGDLENGDAILIVNDDAKVAMSTTQNTNNRGQAEVTITEGTIYAPSEDVQKIILIKKVEEIDETDTDVFYFYTGSGGFLYAASSSSNYLKTESLPDNDNNARATISIQNGNATIRFTGTNTRNVMQYNSSNKLFSCYGSANQAPIQIYREVAKDEAVSISSSKYASYCSPYALDFTDTDVKAYKAKVNGNKVVLTQVDNVPANEGVILYSETADDYNVPVIASADAVTGNEMMGVTERTQIPWESGGMKNYILQQGIFNKANGGYLKANRAYLHTTYDVTAPGARALEIAFDDETPAGIESILCETSTNRCYFNLNGQQVTNPTKGLYIVNGKKVIIK